MGAEIIGTASKCRKPGRLRTDARRYNRGMSVSRPTGPALLGLLLAASLSMPATAQNPTGETGSFGDRQQGHFGDPGNGHFGNPSDGHFGPPQPQPRRDGEQGESTDPAQRPAQDAPFLILDRSADEETPERR